MFLGHVEIYIYGITPLALRAPDASEGTSVDRVSVPSRERERELVTDR